MATDYNEIGQNPRINYRNIFTPYSDKTHFIYELVQNADDNKSQCIELQLYENELIVWNDGCQFREEDVRSICSIGFSNKDLTQIGTFGMGFKAVYTYTDNPEVYSGDERFRISINNPTKPEGIDKIAPKIATLVDDGKTVFCLPFMENLRQEGEIALLKDRLCTLEKRSLLFLRNLKIVHWRDESNGQMGSYSCHRRPHNKIQGVYEVELKASLNGDDQSSETFLIFRKEIQPPQMVIDELLRQSADDDERQRIQRSASKLQPIEVAFKTQDGKITAMNKCVLFSYFPTEKETHLRFFIQASYKTTLARDNIKKDNQWNDWLIKETASFLPDVLEQLKDDGLLETTFFNVLPLEGEVENEFKPIAKALKNAMKERALVPTEKEGHYAKAENVFYPDSKDLRELVKSSGMHPDSSLLHPDIQNNEKFRQCFKVMREAGVEPIRVGRVLTWLEGKSVKWFETRSNKWLRSLYTYLKEQESHLERIKKLPLVRLVDGQHVCTNDQLVFFPPDTDEELEEIKPLLNDLRILKSTLLRKDNDIKKFLEDIGVEVPRPENLIRLICSLYSQPNKPRIMKNRRHVRYIFESWQKAEESERSRLEEIVSKVPILRAYKGTQREISDFIVPRNAYLPQAYTGDNNLETYFSISKGDIWFIDDKYRKNEFDRETWCQFLKAIGTKDTPLIFQREVAGSIEECKKRGITHENSTKPFEGGRFKDIWYRRPYQYFDGHIVDRYLVGLSQVLTQIDKHNEIDVSKALWGLLVKLVSSLPSEEWQREAFFRECFQGNYRWSYNGVKRRFFDADFYRQLKSKSWIPDKRGNLHKPSECFAPTSENRELLGDSVSYLPDSFRTNTATARWLAKKLDVYLQADADGVLDYLQTLSQTQTSIEKIEPIYKFLESESEDAYLWRFEEGPLIFTPEPEPRWWRTDEVFWEDESPVFGNTRGYLKAHYSADLKSFFTTSLEVPECADSVDTLGYIRAIQDITFKGQAETKEIRDRVQKLYRLLWSSLQENEDLLEGGEWPEEWEQLREEAFWLGKKGGEWGFFSPQELVWRDDDHRSDLFKNKVQFWGFDNDLLELAKELGVKGCYQGSGVKFSDSGDQEEDTDWSAKVCNLAKSIYDFLNSPSLCEEYKEEKSAEILDRLSVRRVEKLEVEFELNGISVPDPKPRQSFLKRTGQEAVIWLASEASEDQYAWLIGDALQEHFGDVKELSAYIEDLLTKDRESVLTRWKQKGLRTDIGLPSPEEDSKEDEEKLLDPDGDEFPDEIGDGDDSGMNDSEDETSTGDEGSETGDEDNGSIGDESDTPPRRPRPGGGGARWRGGSGGGKPNRSGGTGYGGGGGGEGEKHRTLKEYLADNPSLFGEGLKLVDTEYRFGSGDEADILFEDSFGSPVTVEVKPPILSGSDQEVWQAVKYKHLAAVEYDLPCDEVRSILAAPEIPEDVKEKCKELGIEPIEVSNRTEA